MANRHIKQSITVLFLALISLFCRAEAEAGAEIDLPEPVLSIIDATILPPDQDTPTAETETAESPETIDFTEATESDQAELQLTIKQYAQTVTQLEIDNGAYNNDLSEALIGLGLAQSTAGNHKDALDVYTRALHINRVNEGLQNINQIPILDLVIEANTALGDYKSLADNYSYLLWVYERNYKNDAPELVPQLQRIAKWHLAAYEVTSPPDSVGHLIVATNLFTKALDIIESTEGYHAPGLINPLYGIVNANFKLVEPFGFIENIDYFTSGRASPLLPSNFNRVNDPFGDRTLARNDFSALNYNQEHLSRILQDQKNTASLIQNSYKSGRNALERIVDIHTSNPGLPKLSHAFALTHLGDWFLRFYKSSSAMANYIQAYQILKDEGYDVEGKGGFFSYPRSLDTFKPPQIDSGLNKSGESTTAGLAGQSESDTGLTADEHKDESKFVLVEFNVTANGSVRNLDIIDSNPTDNIRFQRMARDKIITTPFRPRLENGKPTMTENVKMLYRFE